MQQPYREQPTGYQVPAGYFPTQRGPGPADQPAAGFGESPSDALHWLLPLGRSWQSLVAGYLALFNLLIWPLGPVSVALGIWALVRASRDGSRGRARAVFAVVVGGLSTILLLLVLALQ
jgi:hypothetical protein